MRPVTIETIGRSRVGPLASIMVPPNAMSGASSRRMMCFGIISGRPGRGDLIARPCRQLVEIEQIGAGQGDGLDREMPALLATTVGAIDLAEVVRQPVASGIDEGLGRFPEGIGERARLAPPCLDQHQVGKGVRRRRALLGAGRHGRHEMHQVLHDLARERGVVGKVCDETRDVDDDVAVEQTGCQFRVEKSAGAGLRCFGFEIVDDGESPACPDDNRAILLSMQGAYVPRDHTLISPRQRCARQNEIFSSHQHSSGRSDCGCFQTSLFSGFSTDQPSLVGSAVT